MIEKYKFGDTIPDLKVGDVIRYSSITGVTVERVTQPKKITELHLGYSTLGGDQYDMDRIMKKISGPTT